MNLINHLGVGTVASTKQTGTHEIMVYLPGFAPQADGRVVATAKEVEKTSQNAYGEETKSKVLTSNTFPAEWRAMGDTNRVTSPDVREGSQVSIYQVSGQNKYYWTTWGINAETMRLETVVMGFQANPAQGEDTPFNIDNFYTLTVSTHEGFMALRTTQQNNEKTTFEVKVDAMNGKIMIGGGYRNYLVFDDVARSFTYKNADESVFDINKKKITVVCEDSITFAPKETFSIKTTNFNLLCNKIGIKADEADIHIGETRWNGNIIHTGDYDQTGDYTQAGDTNRTGNSTSTGTVIGAKGVFTALNSLDAHFHGGVRTGDGTTSQPVPGTGAG
jgi:hypothetical protein